VPTPTASLPGVRDADAAERFERLLVAVDTDSAAVAVDDVDATEQVRDPTHAPSAVSDAVQSRDQLPVTPVRLAAVCRPHTACSNSQPHSVSSVDHRLSERQTLAAAALWRVALSTTRATVEMLYKKNYRMERRTDTGPTYRRFQPDAASQGRIKTHFGLMLQQWRRVD